MDQFSHVDLIFDRFVSNLKFAREGLDPDVLNEFPAQRLIQVMNDVKEPVDWNILWLACGGHLHRGQMVALKWDRVWWKISAVNVPVAPFQIFSGYDLEDVDRDEAESLGLLQPGDHPPTLSLDVDLVDLRCRIAALLQAGCRGRF